MDGCLDGSIACYAGRIEVIEGPDGRRFRIEEVRTRIAAKSLVPGAKLARCVALAGFRLEKEAGCREYGGAGDHNGGARLQAEIYARQGIRLDSVTLSNWVGRACAPSSSTFGGLEGSDPGRH